LQSLQYPHFFCFLPQPDLQDLELDEELDEELELLRLEQASQLLDELEDDEQQLRESEQFISLIASLACFLKDFLLHPFLQDELEDDEHLVPVDEDDDSFLQHFLSLSETLEAFS